MALGGGHLRARRGAGGEPRLRAEAAARAAPRCLGRGLAQAGARRPWRPGSRAATGLRRPRGLRGHLGGR
eukprot:8346632-Alexandrium_andersonii.AAC.1